MAEILWLVMLWLTVWHTPSGEPANLRIAEVGDGFVVGVIEPSRMVATTKEPSEVQLSGKFQGALQ